MLRDSNLRSALGRNGRAYVAHHYNWSHILRKYERMFSALAETPREASDRERFRDQPPPPDRRRPPDRERDRDRDRNRDRFRGRGQDRQRGRRR
jgi:hypothetical protein